MTPEKSSNSCLSIFTFKVANPFKSSCIIVVIVVVVVVVGGGACGCGGWWTVVLVVVVLVVVVAVVVVCLHGGGSSFSICPRSFRNCPSTFGDFSQVILYLQCWFPITLKVD